MTGQEEKPQTSASRPWVRSALIASLGVNILIAGMVGGAVLRGGPPDGYHPAREVAVFGLRPYARALDKDGRKALRKALRAGRGDFSAGHKAMSAHLAALADALKADPFDASAVEAELARQAKSVFANVAFGQKLLLDQIRGMSDERRHALAEKLLHPRGHR